MTKVNIQLVQNNDSGFNSRKKLNENDALLAKSVNNKVDREELLNMGVGIKGYGDDVQNISDLENVPDKTEGLAVVVINDQDPNGRSYIWLFDGDNWNRTPFTTLPTDIQTRTNLSQTLTDDVDKYPSNLAVKKETDKINYSLYKKTYEIYNEKTTNTEINVIWKTNGQQDYPIGEIWKATAEPIQVPPNTEILYEGGLFGSNASVLVFDLNNKVIDSFTAGIDKFVNKFTFKTGAEASYLHASFLVTDKFGEILPFKIGILQIDDRKTYDISNTIIVSDSVYLPDGSIAADVSGYSRSNSKIKVKGETKAIYEGGLYNNNASIVIYDENNAVIQTLQSEPYKLTTRLEFTLPINAASIDASFLTDNSYGKILPFRILVEKEENEIGYDFITQRYVEENIIVHKNIDSEITENLVSTEINVIWKTNGGLGYPTDNNWKATSDPIQVPPNSEVIYEGGLYGSNASIVVFDAKGQVIDYYTAGLNTFVNKLTFKTGRTASYLHASYLINNVYGEVLPFKVHIKGEKQELVSELSNVVYKPSKSNKYHLTMRNDNTFVGAFNTVMDMIYAKNKRVRVAMISHFSETSLLGAYGHKGCIDIQKKLANYWGLGILDLSNNLGWIKRNGIDTLTPNVPDFVHPNTDTTNESPQRIARYCVEFLKPIFGDDWADKKVVWIGTSIPAGYPENNDNSRKYPNIAVSKLGGICNNLARNSSTLRLHTTQGDWVTQNVTHSWLDPAKSPNIWTVLDLFGTPNEPDLIVIDHGYNDYNLDQADSDQILEFLKYN